MVRPQMGDAPKGGPSEASGSTSDLPGNTRARYPDRQDDREETTTSADVVCVGEALWDLSTSPGTSLDDATQLSLTPGGGAVNVALTLAQLGLRAGLVASVGDDPVGHALVAHLSRRGVDVSRVRAVKSTRTGLVFLTHAPPRAVAYRAVLEEALALRDALPHAFGASVVHFSGLLPSRACLLALERAARQAQREGALVTIDANLRPRLWAGDALGRADPRRLFAAASVLKVSEDDLRLLGVSDPRDLAPLLRPEAIVVATFGAAETRALGPFGEVRAGGPALAVASTFGAGDAFVAGLLSVLAREGRTALQDRAAIERAIQRGNEVARTSLLEKSSGVK
ncbi:PfkB family carbohydrate kinase [Polyangium jinanense]|uniref:Sugar kinase n=1 Tax=Polyangium jinanense TaxID=2829994 RepID=A0A9X3X1N5_9BACT|nr:PfkB family carbohydrate kinase [Polyangium jinanense]MDC3955055.1 sugar kinase [Polyangium jinanense]MDC3981175.1 sugar kinase [Polyangium jinanense]